MPQPVLVERDGTLRPEDVEPVDLRGPPPVRHEVAHERHGRPSAAGAEHQGRAVLAPDGVAVAAELRRAELHGPQEEAQGVDVVDHHLHQQHPLQPAHHRLAPQRRQRAVLVRDQAPGKDAHERLADGADAPFPQPLGDPPVVRAEAPVLVHHQPGADGKPVHQGLRLGERGRERLLAEDGKAARHGEANVLGVPLARAGHVHGVDPAAQRLQHRLGRGEALRDAVGLHAGRARAVVGVGHGDHGRALGHGPVAVEMVLGDPAGADQGDA